MDSLVPGPIKGRAALDGNVGGIWCESDGILSQDKGLPVVDPILASDKQVTPLLPDRLVLNILVSIENLVGKEVGMCKGHSRLKRQIGREVGEYG